MATVRRGVELDRSGGHRGDVFPALRAYIVAGAVAGIITATIKGEVLGQGGDSLTPVALSAVLGGILGLFLGLSRGVWRAGQRFRLPEAAPSHRLWIPG